MINSLPTDLPCFQIIQLIILIIVKLLRLSLKVILVGSTQRNNRRYSLHFSCHPSSLGIHNSFSLINNNYFHLIFISYLDRTSHLVSIEYRSCSTGQILINLVLFYYLHFNLLLFKYTLITK